MIIKIAFNKYECNWCNECFTTKECPDCEQGCDEILSPDDVIIDFSKHFLSDVKRAGGGVSSDDAADDVSEVAPINEKIDG